VYLKTSNASTRINAHVFPLGNFCRYNTTPESSVGKAVVVVVVVVDGVTPEGAETNNM
jgi:hypothetical protein